jgi:hypothetical protein
MNMNPEEYRKLKGYVYKHATLHGFKPQDCDDILHDALLYIIEYNINPIDYYKIIWKYIGKHRERRNRESKRQVDYDDNQERE